MPNVHFGRSLQNVLLTGGTTIRIVNTAGTTITTLQDNAYPVSNLLNADRYSVWSTGTSTTGLTTPPNDAYVQFLFQTSQGSLRYWGWHGMRLTRIPAVQLSNINMFYSLSNPPVSNPLDTSWVDTSVPLTQTGNPDGYAELPSTLPNGVWGVQFRLTGIINGGSLVSFLLGNFSLFRSSGVNDLGATMIYSPGSSRVQRIAQARVVSANGAVHVTDFSGGFQHHEINMQFRSVTNTIRGIMLGLGAETRPIVYRDHLGTTYQILPAENGLTITHIWGPPDLYDIEFRAQTLP